MYPNHILDHTWPVVEEVYFTEVKVATPRCKNSLLRVKVQCIQNRTSLKLQKYQHQYILVAPKVKVQNGPFQNNMHYIPAF